MWCEGKLPEVGLEVEPLKFLAQKSYLRISLSAYVLLGIMFLKTSSLLHALRAAYFAWYHGNDVAFSPMKRDCVTVQPLSFRRVHSVCGQASLGYNLLASLNQLFR